MVELVDLAGIRPEEPFLKQTVARAEQLGRTRVPQPLTEYLATAPVAAPHALIFHVGRCGSSVLVNMLNALPHVLVISEPPFVNGLIRRSLERVAIEGDGARDVLARGVAAAAQPWNGEPVTILKTVSWNLVAGFELMRRFPETLAVFLTREPEAVVRSNLRTPPAWNALTERDPDLLRALIPTLRDRASLPTGAELYAHAWRAQMERADWLPRERTLHLHHEDLVADPPAWLDQVLSHLRIDVDDEQRRAMLDTARFHAKVPGQRFDPQVDAERALSEDDLRTVRAVTAQTERRRRFDRLVFEMIAPAVAPFGFDTWQLDPSPDSPRRGILFHADPEPFQARYPHLMSDYGTQEPTCIDLWIHLDEATGSVSVDLESAHPDRWLSERGLTELLDATRSPEVEVSVPAFAEVLRRILSG